VTAAAPPFKPPLDGRPPFSHKGAMLERSWITTENVDTGRLTPVMMQVVPAKRRHPDAIVFFRLGDFYELFFEDALLASRALDLTLTSRNRDDPEPIPMCGVPHHASRSYLQKLLDLGHRVAVCEQMEDPSKVKGIVKREVTHVVTPGVVLDPEALDARTPNRVMALVAMRSGAFGLAQADVTTGEFRAGVLAHVEALETALWRLEPREIVADGRLLAEVGSLVERLGRCVKTCREGRPRAETEEARRLGEGGAEAAGLLRSYLADVNAAALPMLARCEPLDAGAQLLLGREALQHLEILRTARDGRREGSLLHAVDRTSTPMGARLLRSLLVAPLAERRSIESRHACVEHLFADRPLREALCAELAHVSDLERLLGRSVARVATPRDVAAVRETLRRAAAIRGLLTVDPQAGPLDALAGDLDGGQALYAFLCEAIDDTPPLGVADGGVIRAGFDAQLDALVRLTTDAQGWLAAFEATERARTGIASLKVRYNRVTGYGIEITKANLGSVPADYIRKQSLANGERFYTPELKAFEAQLLTAESDRLAREEALFAEVRARIAAEASLLGHVARALARLDVHAGFATVAAERSHVRPNLNDERRLRLVAARHPVLEALMPPGAFVPNDLALEAEGPRVLLITGPNMAGKSTLMRQVALCAILAQAGAFVPAEQADLPILDAIFTRIGASDDIAGGASTFMVEMQETARLLRLAGPRSLVLLDEIGRGTSTYDGLSIAWAVVEHLHDSTRAFVLFATHYHELTALEEALPAVSNVHVAVRDFEGRVVFLHRLQSGATNRSHGIAVARLAGLPDAVIERSRAVLAVLEQGRDTDTRRFFEGAREVPRQAGLFGAPQPEPTADDREGLVAALAALDVEALTPVAALAELDALSRRARLLAPDPKCATRQENRRSGSPKRKV